MIGAVLILRNATCTFDAVFGVSFSARSARAPGVKLGKKLHLKIRQDWGQCFSRSDGRAGRRRPDTDWFRTASMGALGTALTESSQTEEALPVLEANLALRRRYWSHDERGILSAKIILRTASANLDGSTKRSSSSASLCQKLGHAGCLGRTHHNDRRVCRPVVNQIKSLRRGEVACARPAAARGSTSLGLDDDLTLMLNEI